MCCNKNVLVLKLKLELSASTSSCIFHICAWNNHKQSSIPSGFVSQPKCLGHQNNNNHLFYNTMDHFLPTQLLPFTCSLNFFCNIALNGLPDVDLGIYNEKFLNHKISCDWKPFVKPVPWTTPYPQSRSHHVTIYGGRALVDTRLQALWWLYLRRASCLHHSKRFSPLGLTFSTRLWIWELVH